jgi:hypothetical protein
MVMHDEDMSLIHFIRFRTSLKEWTRASPLQNANPLDRNQRRRDFLKTRSCGPTDGTCVQRIVKGIIKTVMLTCPKQKLADQNLRARDSARSRNIRRSRKRISAIIRIQVGRISWKKRITDLLLCDSMPLPDLQVPGSCQSRFASNSPRRNS